MKKLFLPLLIFTFSSCLFAGLVGYTTNVTGDGMIEIDYEVESDDSQNTLPVFEISLVAEIMGKKKPAKIKTLLGDGSTGVVVGPGTYKLVWDAKKDCKRTDPASIAVKFGARDVTAEAKYLCLDLKTCRMRYQNDPPDVKKSACKTKELWLRRIEPGTFTMGSPIGELGRDAGEIQHEVTLSKAFYLSLFETTQKQFKYIAGYNVSKYKGSTRPMDGVTFDLLRGSELGSGWPKNRHVDEKHFYTDKKGNNVECPTFFYALREKTGGSLVFDLPTEAQWEYACRAGKTTAWNNGTDITEEDEDPELSKLGRYFYNGGCKNIYDKKGVLKSTKRLGTTKAGSYLPNGWGLYDMHGNAYEWCLDWYAAYPGGSSVTDPLGPDSGLIRVCRGGSWDDPSVFCRSAHRNVVFIPGLSDFSTVGFRVALVTSETASGREEFEYELLTDSDSTLPVFRTRFYGKDKNGNEFLLSDYGKLEEDGASGIVLGAGIHKGVWLPDADHTNLIGSVEYSVKYEEVTDQARYLVLDLAENKMRVSLTGPDLSEPSCRGQEIWFSRIEPGTFTMGSPANEKGSAADENQRSVTLKKAFYMAVFETTQAQYWLLTGWRPSQYLGDMRPAEQVSYNALRGSTRGAQWPKGKDVDKNSVMGKITSKAGNRFDLPTEAMWEYACRAGKTTALNNGTNLSNVNEDENLNKLGRYHYNTGDGRGGFGEHTEVGSYLPNDWGLFDTHGNVYEWCLDWYSENLGTDPAKDPKGPETGEFRVFRGGSFNEAAKDCRCAARMFYVPESAFYYNGFRFCLTSRGKMTRQNLVYDLPSVNTLPVFTVRFYGKTDDGTEYLLSDIGTLEGEGFSGVAIGSGSKKITWIPDSDHEDLPGELEMRVEYEDITSEAKYVVLTMSNNWLRVSKDAPDLEYGSIGSGSPCRYEELWLKRIEPSTFNMGSPEGELGRDLDSDDETRHQVRLTKPYYIGIFEVTQGQYKQVAQSNPSKYTGGFRPVQNVSYDMIRGADKGANFPADNDVDPDSFLGKLRARSFCYFDLPTEAQWEFACRAGTTTALNNGTNLSDENEDENLNKLACYYYNYGTVEDSNGNRKYVGPTNVGNWLPNNWGLYDMHGNVSEWSLDWIADYNGDETDPKGPESGYYRVFRSFGWNHLANRCRSASRGCTDPSISGMSVGFRLVIIPKE